VKASFRISFASALIQRYTAAMKSPLSRFDPRFGSCAGEQFLTGLLSDLYGLLRPQAH